MKLSKVLVARVYVSESSKLISKITHYLQNEAGIRGFSVFRAISGFGETGDLTSKFVDVSVDLPVAIEFFDSEEKVQVAIKHIDTLVTPWHILVWEAKTNAY